MIVPTDAPLDAETAYTVTFSDPETGESFSWSLDAEGICRLDGMEGNCRLVATGAGYESIGALAAANDASQAGAIMFVMSIGIMFGIVTCTFFGKKIQTSMTSFREKNGAWGALATGCFTLALMVVFLPVQVFKGPIYMLTLAVSALVTYLHGVIIKKTGWTWLSNFVLADSLVLAMVASVFFANLLA